MLAIIKSMRPKQWVKNAFVLAPLIFSLEFLNISSWVHVSLAVVAFIFVSGAIYIINDLSDIESDKKHPRKKLRPIASGELSKPAAIISAIFFIAVGIILSSILPSGCLGVLVIYFVLNYAYSGGLKQVAILDVLIIAIGFVLRVIMGGYAIGVVVSPWIIMTTFMLALFLGFGKRRHEVRKDKGKMRASLEFYNKEFLDKLINVSCASALLSYAMYVVEIAQKIGRTEIVYTIAFVAFGLFRYLQFIYFNKKGGEPERIIFADGWFAGNIFAWLLTTLWILAW